GRRRRICSGWSGGKGGLLLPSTPEAAGGHRDGQDQGRGPPEGRPRAGELEEGESRGEKTRGGAAGVGGGGRGASRAASVARGRSRARGGGQRAAHGQRRHGEDERAQHEPPDGADGGAQGQRAAAREVRRSHQPEQKRTDRRGDGDDHFELGIQEERSRMAVGARAEDETAGAKTADENREHRRGGSRRRAEDQAEFTEPRDSINERAEAGTEQKGRNRPRAGAHRRPEYRAFGSSASASRRGRARRRHRPPAAAVLRVPA